MDEYKSRLSAYLSDMVREELEKYDGGFADEWNDQRKKNAEVLGYKLSGKSDIKEAVKDPKLKVGQKIRHKNDPRKVYTLKKITHGNRGIPEDPAGTSYMFVASGNRKEYHTKKTWAQAIKKGWIIKESINEAYKVHAKSKLGIGPKKWELEKFLTGGKSFDFKKGMEIVKKLRRMSSSIDYKLIKESVNEEAIEMSKGVQKLMKIATGGYGKVGGTTVDSMSANLFKQVYNKASDDIKQKINKMNEKQLVNVLHGMWKKFGKNVKL